MKRILTALTFIICIVFSVALTSCDIGDITIPDTDDTTVGDDDGNQNGDNSDGGEDSAYPECEHKDENEDGTCDSCKLGVSVEIEILVVNDLHGKIYDTDSHIGVDELTTYIKQLRAENENLVLLSSGDMWQGSYESNLTHGLMMTDWMNHVGFDSMTVGNHEYDWGDEYIKENDKLAEFPILAINIFDRETNERMEYCKPSVMLSYNGFKVGVIGAIGDCYSSIATEKCSNVYFKVGGELTALVKAEATRLREAGADLVIYSLHDGYGESLSQPTEFMPSKFSGYYNCELSNGYVDAVFESHTHQSYIITDSYGVYHMQGGGDNSAISRLTMTLNIVSGEHSVKSAQIVKTSAYASLADDPIVSSLAEKYADEVAAGEELIANVPSEMNSNVLRNKIADLYLEAGLEKWGTQYNIFLGGGYLSARKPYSIYPGDVYYKDIYGIFPFDNDLTLCSVKGASLKKNFINNNSYFISYSDYGYNNRGAVSDTGTYYIIVDTYSAYYKYNQLTVIDFYESGVYARDLLSDYLEQTYPPKENENESGSGGNTGDNESGGASSDSYDGSYYTLTSIKEVLDIAKSVDVGYETTDKHYVIGKIKSIDNSEYGNVYLTDSEGNELYVYGIVDENDNYYGTLAKKPTLGETVILLSPIVNYKGTIELKHALLVSYGSEKTASELNSIGAANGYNTTTAESYLLTCTIYSISNSEYGNFTVKDNEGTTFTIYGTLDMAGTKFQSFRDEITAGDTVVLLGQITNYRNNSGTYNVIEFKNATLIGKL